jgi:hypothetical protein
MAIERRPVKKFAQRTFSKARAARIKRVRVKATQKAAMPVIFNTAEKILHIENPRGTRLIFVGQAMRPLFEAVRAINQVEIVFPQRNIRYFISTAREFALDRDSGKMILKRRIGRISPVMQKLGIVSGGINTYCIFDFRSRGTTLDAITGAIKKIKPTAKVIEIDGDSKEFGPGINAAEAMPKPTRKSSSGRLLPSADQELRNEYLAFQFELQKYLDERKAKKK